MRFMFSRRWLVFALAVAAGAWGAMLLGQWQFHRLDERRAENRLIARNLAAAPVPFEDVFRIATPLGPQLEWRRVSVRGTWDDQHTIVLKYQTRKGEAGIDVVTPMLTGDGVAVLVDRGWMATRNSGGTRPDTPPVTRGAVSVTGWARADGTGGSTRVDQLATRALSSSRIAQVLPYRLYGGFIDLDRQTPPPKTTLGKHELPDDTSNGPHFFYGLQWWFFGAMAIFGFGYLAYDEWRTARAVGGEPAASPAASQGPQHPAVDGEHRPGDE